jgi:hypothetical protein
MARQHLMAFVCAALFCACTTDQEDLGNTVSNATTGADVVLRESLQGATAIFSDVSGCLRTDAFVLTNLEGARTSPSPQVSGEIVAVFVSAENICTGETILLAEGISNDLTLTVSPNLTSATLSATVIGRDLTTGEPITFEINLTWSAIAAPVALASHDQDRSIPGFVIIRTMRALARDAVATGTILVGDINFAPSPSIEASIQDVQQGTIVVRRELPAT